jgi:hypothetical protein
MSHINKNQMKEVEEVLQDMVAYLLLKKPEEPVPYML